MGACSLNSMTNTPPPSRAEPRLDLANASVPQQVQGPELPKLPHTSTVVTPVVALLEASKPIAFNINFARITGDMKAALLLSQLVYWTRRGADVLDNDGWVFKTREQWEAEIGLSKHEQATARGILVGLGIIEEARTGAPARNCYRVLPGVLGAHLAQLVRSEPVQWSLLDIRSDSQQIRTMLGRQFAFYRLLMQITSTCTSAIYLSKALAIQRRFADRQPQQPTRGSELPSQLPWDTDWFRMAVDSTQADTGLSPAQQRDAKHKLCQIGLMQQAMMTHPRKQLYLRVDMQLLNQLLETAAKTGGQNRAAGIDVMESRFSSNQGEWKEIIPLATNDLNLLPHSPNHDPGLIRSPTVGTEAGEDPAACQNRPTRKPDSAKLDVRFSQGRWPDLARPKSGFSTPSGPVLAGLHARASCAGQDYKEDYIKTTTTTQAPSKLEVDPPKPDILQSKPVFSAGDADSGAMGLSTAAVVVVPTLNSSEQEAKPQWIWPEAFTKVEQVQGARILESLAKTGQLDDAQNILDELAGWIATGSVKSNLSYLRGLVVTHQSTPGGLIYERGPDVRLRRERRAAVAAIAHKDSSPEASIGSVVSRGEESKVQEVAGPVVLTDAAKSGLAKAREMLVAYKKGSS